MHRVILHTLCLVLFSNILSYRINWGVYYACTGVLEQVQFRGGILIWNLIYFSCDSMKALSRILFLPRHIASRSVVHMEPRDEVLICGLTSSFGNMNNLYCYIAFHPFHGTMEGLVFTLFIIVVHHRCKVFVTLLSFTECIWDFPWCSSQL